MNVTQASPPWSRWLLCLLLVLICVAVLPGPVVAAPRATLAAPSPLYADLLNDVVGNRTRLIQVSFLFILVGIFILWKK
jgi:hypothetical protein